MPRKPEYTGISIKTELAQDVETFVKEHPTKYRSLTHFVEDSAIERLKELRTQLKELPRFDRINGDDTGVLIYDRELKENKAVHVSVRPNGVMCDFHQRTDCEHVKYALKLPDVQEMIKKRRKEGWKIEVSEDETS